MTIDLKKASILYLDDEPDYLDDTKNMFNANNFHLDTTNSVDYALDRTINNKVDIFICDLRLDLITTEIRGDELLLKIRRKNKKIFLALYSAWLADLTSIDRKKLAENNIVYYPKADESYFIHNFPSDFFKFQENLIKEEDVESGLNDDELTQDLIDGIIEIIQGVSNQQTIVPIKGDSDITIEKLINELINKTNTGRRFLKDWIQSDLVYRKLKG